MSTRESSIPSASITSFTSRGIQCAHLPLIPILPKCRRRHRLLNQHLTWGQNCRKLITWWHSDLSQTISLLDSIFVCIIGEEVDTGRSHLTKTPSRRPPYSVGAQRIMYWGG